MKKPRITDFDPNAQVPELGSPLAGMPAIERPTTVASQREHLPPATTSVAPQPEPYGPPSVRPYARTPVRRTITRYAFEFFQDQIESLRRLSLAEKNQGEKGSMSEMVRDALDAYIARRTQSDEEPSVRPYARPYEPSEK